MNAFSMAAIGRILAGFVLIVSFLVTSAAQASEVKFAAQPLATDDSGKLTAAGRKSATAEIPSVPGDDLWNLHVWAQIDKGGPGPLYVEFFGKLPDGKKYLAHRHEHPEYGGEKYVTMEIELDGNLGFNKGKTYAVELTQVSAAGKNLKLASGSITLAETEGKAAAEEADSGEDGETEQEAVDTADQDALDTLVGGEEGQASDQGPPPVEPGSKKGCSVDPETYGVSGVLVLFVLGLGAGRRRA
jgi:MYXO-CTERM domain-containing protein